MDTYLTVTMQLFFIIKKIRKKNIIFSFIIITITYQNFTIPQEPKLLESLSVSFKSFSLSKSSTDFGILYGSKISYTIQSRMLTSYDFLVWLNKLHKVFHWNLNRKLLHVHKFRILMWDQIDYNNIFKLPLAKISRNQFLRKKTNNVFFSWIKISVEPDVAHNGIVAENIEEYLLNFTSHFRHFFFYYISI